MLFEVQKKTHLGQPYHVPFRLRIGRFVSHHGVVRNLRNILGDIFCATHAKRVSLCFRTEEAVVMP